MSGFLKILGDAMPIFIEWLQWVINVKDREWEDISKAWPEPTKTKIARLRAEAKAHDAFFGED